MMCSLTCIMVSEKPWASDVILTYYYSKYLRRDNTLNLSEFFRKYGIKNVSTLRRMYQLHERGYIKFNLKGNTFELTPKGLRRACIRWEHPSYYGLTKIRYGLYADLLRLGVLEQPEREHIKID